MTAAYTVIICHGSYHTPAPYAPFVSALKEKGIEAYCPQLPTSDLRKLNVGLDTTTSPSGQPDFNNPPPPEGYPQPADDALVINELLNKLVEKEGKNVVLVGHSSGGFVATYVARSKYQRKVRQEKNLAGGVIGIFYVCAFLVTPGNSVHSFFQPKDGSPDVVPPYCQFHVSIHLYLCTCLFFFADESIYREMDSKVSHPRSMVPGTFSTAYLKTKQSTTSQGWPRLQSWQRC